MLGWVKWLLYIFSFVIPPVGVITFWVFFGQGEEPKVIAKWSLVAAFIGCVIWVILSVVGVTMHEVFWRGMGRW
jgi:membrane protease YdiL (CAAX protease family)